MATRKEVLAHKGSMTVGPIPAGVDVTEFIKSKNKLSERVCILIYNKPKKYKKDKAQYPLIQGTYWILHDGLRLLK